MARMKMLSPNLLIFIWSFLRNHKWKLYGICLAIFIASLSTVINSYLLKILVDTITIDNAHLNFFSDRKYLMIGALFVILSIFGNLIWRVINYLSLKTFPAVRARVFSKTFNYLSSHSHQYFQDNLSGDLANKIQDIAEGIESIFEPLFSIIYIIFTVLVAIAIVYTINFYFALALVIWVIFFISISLILSKGIISYSRDFAQIRSVLSGRCVDSLMNIFNVNLFARQAFEKSYLNNTSAEVMKKDMDLRWELLKLWAIQGFLSTFILSVMIFILFFLHSKDIVTTGDFVFIISLTTTIIQQIFGTAELISRILGRIGICNQAISLVYAPYTIVEMENAITFNIRKAEIIFKNVSFFYKEDNILFKDLNITIAANQKIGLVGYSGSGKTTFVNLLLRLYDLQNGEILVDGQNIKDVTISSIRENIAFIPQNPVLFHRSFMDNIRYGRLDATDEEVIEAAKKAHAHEFILETHEGYNSLLGENGIKISGGQRQRIAIARAILKNAPILILDEATSSLDSVTEVLIQESLKELMHGKTVIIIAHRLSTLFSMDRILVFNQGKIVEDGSHKDLLAQRKLYFTLWNSQIGGFLGDEF